MTIDIVGTWGSDVVNLFPDVPRKGLGVLMFHLNTCTLYTALVFNILFYNIHRELTAAMLLFQKRHGDAGMAAARPYPYLPNSGLGIEKRSSLGRELFYFRCQLGRPNQTNEDRPDALKIPDPLIGTAQKGSIRFTAAMSLYCL